MRRLTQENKEGPRGMKGLTTVKTVEGSYVWLFIFTGLIMLCVVSMCEA